MDSYGTRLRQARISKGYSLEEATFRLRGLLDRRISTRTIGRMEANSPGEDTVDEVVVVGLCQLYEVSPLEISEAIARRAERSALVLAGGASTNPDDGGAASDLRGLPSPWMTETAA